MDLKARIKELEAEVATLDAKPPVWAQLADLMSRLSEDYYCAGWLIGLEYDLWRAIFAERRFGFGEIPAYDLLQLARLADQLGGWVVWDDEKHKPKFVFLNEWLQIYRTHQAFHAEEQES
jgi:hypothetical protein